MYLDFYNSMQAAWTPEELASTIPLKSNRKWIHIVPQGLASLQVILGVPVSQKDLFLREGLDWKSLNFHNSLKSVTDWKVLNDAFATATIVELNPSMKKDRKEEKTTKKAA